MKTIFITIIILLSFKVYAQQEKSFEEQVNYIFEKLNTEDVETGFLIDKGNPFFNFHEYQASKKAYYLEDFDEFTAAYASIQTAHLPNSKTENPFYVPPSDYQQVRNWAKQEHSTVPVALILHEYDFITQEAMENGMVQAQNEQLVSQASDTSTIYKQATLFLPQMVKKAVEGPDIIFTFPQKLWFASADYTAESFAFDAGNGFRQVKAGDQLSVQYTIPGSQIVQFKWMHPVTKEEYTIYTFLDVQWANEQYPAAYTNLADLTVTGPDVGYAKVSISYGESSNRKLDKPIIVAEGFDPSDIIEDRCSAPLQDYNYFFEQKLNEVEARIFKNNLQSNGYDIVHIDFANTTNTFESNAEVVKKVIRWVNATKVAGSNGLKNKNVMMGLSMGNILIRYALRDMEMQGEDHDARLFVSFDGPHRGANQAIGAQYFAQHMATARFLGFWYMKDVSGSLEQAQLLLNSPVARQMSILHHGGRTEHLTFYNKLKNMGMPRLTRNVAISNGNPTLNNGAPGSTIVDFNLNRDFCTDLFGSPFRIPISNLLAIFYGTTARVKAKVNAVSMNQQIRVYDGEIKVWVGFIPVTVSNQDNGYRADASYDTSPGSKLSTQDCCPISYNIDGTFMPTFSALGMEKELMGSSTTILNNNTCLSDFDAWHTSPSSNFHVTFTQSNTNFIWNEINSSKSPCQQKMCKDVSIAGTSSLCSTGTFTLNNLPEGASISWTRSSNLSYVSGQNTSAYRVSPSGSGAGWVEARITLNDCGTAVIRKTINVGKPSLSNFYPSGPTSRSTYQYGYYTVPIAQGGTSQVMKILRNGSVVATGNATNIGYTFTEIGNYRVIAEANNNCGTISSGLTVAVGGSGGGGACAYQLDLTSSNPSSSIFHFRIIEPPIEEPCIVMKDDAVKNILSRNSISILDQYGNTIINQSIKQELFEIDLTSKESGMYFVRVNWKGQQLSDRIMKK